MNLNELIERLEEYCDELGGDAKVRLMTQQNWPFKNEIAGLASGQEIIDAGDDEDDDDEDLEEDEVVYICEGRQLGYGNGRAWEVAH